MVLSMALSASAVAAAELLGAGGGPFDPAFGSGGGGGSQLLFPETTQTSGGFGTGGDGGGGSGVHDTLNLETQDLTFSGGSGGIQAGDDGGFGGRCTEPFDPASDIECTPGHPAAT